MAFITERDREPAQRARQPAWSKPSSHHYYPNIEAVAIFGLRVIRWHLVFLPHQTFLEAKGKKAPHPCLQPGPDADPGVFFQWLCLLCPLWLLMCVPDQPRASAGESFPPSKIYVDSVSARAVGLSKTTASPTMDCVSCCHLASSTAA